MHEGNSVSGGGCYTKEVTKKVFSHNETYTYHPSAHDDDGDGNEDCPNCHTQLDTGKYGSAVCTKCTLTGTRKVYKTVVDYYDLNCGKTEDTIESATIIY